MRHGQYFGCTYQGAGEEEIPAVGFPATDPDPDPTDVAASSAVVVLSCASSACGGALLVSSGCVWAGVGGGGGAEEEEKLRVAPDENWIPP